MLNGKQEYTYNDEHLYFYFNNIYSKHYNLFIENGGSDLQVVNTASPSNQYSSPAYQNYTYYLGTTLQQRTLKYKVAAEGLTQERYKEMMLWLSEGTRGFLTLDSNWYWGYDVIVDTVGDATMLYNNRGITTEFEITFKTYGSPWARSYYKTSITVDAGRTAKDEPAAGEWDDDVYTVIEHASLNQYGIPEMVYTDDATYTDTTDLANPQNTKTARIICIPQLSNKYSYIDIYANITDTQRTQSGYLSIIEKAFFGTDTEWAQLIWSNILQIQTINYYGNHNTLLINNTFPELIEEGIAIANTLQFNQQNDSIFLMQNECPQLLPAPTKDGNILHFLVPYTWLNYIQQGRTFIAYSELDTEAKFNAWDVNPWKTDILSSEDSNTGTLPQWANDAYPYPYHSWILFDDGEYQKDTKPLITISDTVHIIGNAPNLEAPMWVELSITTDALQTYNQRKLPIDFSKGHFYIGHYHKIQINTSLQSLTLMLTTYNNL